MVKNVTTKLYIEGLIKRKKLKIKTTHKYNRCGHMCRYRNGKFRTSFFVVGGKKSLMRNGGFCQNETPLSR
jgi:hypothetical protein